MRFLPILLSLAALAVALSPVAVGAGEGDPILGGERNPSPDQSKELRDETEVIARTGEYGTRQSNKGAGGGAIYGCRSSRQAAAKEIACLRANNLRDGRAFSFETSGPIAGEIEVGDPANQPFVTNGRGKVENLHADLVDATEVAPIFARAIAGSPPPLPVVDMGGLKVNVGCGADGDIVVTATTDAQDAVIHSVAIGVGEGQRTFEDKDDDFDAGETYTAGFDQSHSGFIRYIDADNSVTIDLSTDEQGGSPPSCLAFGTAMGGPLK